MSVNYLNEIISIFLQRNVNELSDNDLNTAIRATGRVCSTEEIHRAVRVFGSSLFQLRCNKEGIFLLRIEPKISICRDFLAGRCSPKPGGCHRLHLCRFFGDCRKKDCHSSHDLNDTNNRRIITQSNCQHVDAFLLIRLIKLYNRFSHHPFQISSTARPVAPKSTGMIPPLMQPKPVHRVFKRSNRTDLERVGRDRTSHADNRIQSINLPSTSDKNYQIDVSLPSISNGSSVTIETIESFLRSQGLHVQKSFSIQTNENFHRWTLQLEEENDAVDDLLARSVIPHEGFHMKFKRTNPIIDSKSFILQSTIDFKKGAITIEKFSTYVDILINHSSYKLTDLSSPLEQILLIQCDKVINFDQLCCLHKSRRQVQGTDILLKQVYEIETAIIESAQTSLSSAAIQNITASINENVFTFTLVSNHTAYVEFIHADALEQWLSISDIIKQKFNVDIRLSIKYVDKDYRNNATRCSPTSQSTKSEADNMTSQTTINLSRQWAMIAGHPVFSTEYKDYIRSETGFEIDIRGNQVHVHCASTSDTFSKEHPSSLLNNRTMNFMQNFTFHSKPLQQPIEQLAILRAHSSLVAFARTRRNRYLIAAKKSEIEDLMQKLLPKQPVDEKPISHPRSEVCAAQAAAKPMNQKQTSTFVVPSPLMNSIPIDEKTMTSDEIITKSLTLPIDTPAQIALFADKTFENCLQAYFYKTYNIKFNIELTTENSGRRIIKIVGQHSSVDESLEELLTLISLFRTKTFDEMTDDRWVKISDATRVIQHQFNLGNIVCVCQQQTSPFSIQVHHIDEKHNKLGLSEQIIERLCRKQLILTTCKSIRFEQEWTTLKTEIIKRDDYGKNICLLDEQQTITLYGVPQVVRDVQQRFESINKKDDELNNVPVVIQSKMNKSEKPFVGDLSIGKLLMKQLPVENPSTEKLPIEKLPVKNPSTANLSTGKLPVRNPSTEKLPIGKLSIKKLPVKNPSTTNLSTGKLPVRNPSTEKLPIGKLSIKKLPVQNSSTQKLLIEELPVGNSSTEKLPIGKLSIEKLPVQNSSTQKLLIEELPVRNSSTEKLPIEKLPVQNPSTEKLPIEKLPVRNPSIEKVPIGKLVVQNPSTEKLTIGTVPIEKLPVQNSSTEKVRIEKLPVLNPLIAKLSIAKPRYLNVENSTGYSESIMHSGNNQTISQKPETRSIVFYVDEPGFEVLINQEFNQLLTIVNWKCSLDKQIIHQKIQIPVPKAKVYKFEDSTSDVQSQEKSSKPLNDSNEPPTKPAGNWFSGLFKRKKPKPQAPNPTSQVPSASTTNNTASVNIGQSKIIVCIGDLTKQAGDAIVVCSTSKILCDSITSAAGSAVENVYKQKSLYGIVAFETLGGNLPCKQIIFRPWVYDKNHSQDLKQSTDTFVASIITYAIRQSLTTIAFPSIGCGQLGHDPKTIAEYMIGETYRQLKSSLQSQLIVSFVLLPGQKTIYDVFADQLNMMQSIDDVPTSIPFDKQTVKITLIGPDDNVLIECRNKIQQLAQTCSCKLHLTDKTDMADWPQSTIQKYYENCLQKRVIPTLDIQNSILDLIGFKDAVSEAEKYYLQLTADTLRNARIQVISRGFVWSVEVSSGKWEQYPSRISQQIEDAQLKHLLHVDFMNEKSERCRVIFSSMDEQFQQRKRKVCRKRIDSSLPNNWDLSAGNFKRVVLLDSSKEYKDVQNQFDVTMKGRYSKIVKIERIQNERWYKQYAAHRDEFTQRYNQPDERSLFHGCNSISADKIVKECFNRAFAGVNGIMYGCGVYFHEQANYSHNYAKADISGERTMFLARVLIGKTCPGNSSMKVPPEGFDTTTDGRHIFVVYHDAAAYGEYLILYK